MLSVLFNLGPGKFSIERSFPPSKFIYCSCITLRSNSIYSIKFDFISTPQFIFNSLYPTYRNSPFLKDFFPVDFLISLFYPVVRFFCRPPSVFLSTHVLNFTFVNVKMSQTTFLTVSHTNFVLLIIMSTGRYKYPRCRYLSWSVFNFFFFLT